MDLNISNKHFLVTGATSGFGKAVTESLIKEGAVVIANARRNEKLEELKKKFGKQLIVVSGDVQDESVRDALVTKAIAHNIDGVFINAGGPAAGGAMEISLQQLDEAYNLVLRWKVDLVQKLMPFFIVKNYGRLVFLESSSIKQPIDNLALSNTLRMAVAGYVKTLSVETAQHGITMNLLAPGFHETDAVKRIYKKRAELSGLSAEEIKLGMVQNTPVQKIGNPNDLATLATWLLSPKSGFVTGQVYTLDGGAVKGNL